MSFKVQTSSSVNKQTTLRVKTVQATSVSTSGLSVGISDIISSSTYTLDLHKTIFSFDTNSHAIAVTVPDGTIGKIITLINTSLSGNTITLAGNMCDGYNSVEVSSTYSFFWNGSSWMPISYWQSD